MFLNYCGHSYTFQQFLSTCYFENIPFQAYIFGENETYKYLGILEADTIKQAEMKEKI